MIENILIIQTFLNPIFSGTLPPASDCQRHLSVGRIFGVALLFGQNFKEELKVTISFNVLLRILNYRVSFVPNFQTPLTRFRKITCYSKCKKVKNTNLSHLDYF
jgi:hypothetical protein